MPHLERQNWTLIIKGRVDLGYGTSCCMEGSSCPQLSVLPPHPAAPTVSRISLGHFLSAHWNIVRHSPKFTQTSLHVFSDSIGSNVPMATLLSVFGSCHKLLDIFSYKIVKLGCRETRTVRDKNRGFSHQTISSTSRSGSPIDFLFSFQHWVSDNLLFTLQ